MNRLYVDVAGVADVGDGGAQHPRQGLRAFERDKGIVTTRYDYALEGELSTRHGSEPRQHPTRQRVLVHVRGRDQQRHGDVSTAGKRRKMRNQGAAETMSDKDSAWSPSDGVGEARRPSTEIGTAPVRLIDPFSPRQGALPVTLPVGGSRPVDARHNQKRWTANDIPRVRASVRSSSGQGGRRRHGRARPSSRRAPGWPRDARPALALAGSGRGHRRRRRRGDRSPGSGRC